MPIRWEKLKKTRYPGIRRRPEDGAVVAQVKQTDPRTGRKVVLTRIIQSGNFEDALSARVELIRRVKTGTTTPEAHAGKMTLGSYAQLWIIRKRNEGIREHTIEFYVSALERRILPALGNLYLDAITSRDIFRWRDQVMALRTAKGEPYSRWTTFQEGGT